MNRKDESTIETCLLVTTKQERSYDGRDELRIDVCVVTREGSKVRNPSDGPWDNLSLYGWTYRDNDDSGVFYKIAYRDVYSIEAHEALTMHKTLTTIGRKQDKMNDAEGYATSIGQAVNRFARAIGAKVLLSYSKNNRAGWSYDDSTFIDHPLSSMQWFVDGLVKEFKTPSKDESQAA
jgi:hypothetical protein